MILEGIKMNDARYRLQEKRQKVMPNILGGRSMPVYTYEWRDIAVCAEREPLLFLARNREKPENYRVIDTMEAQGQ